MHNRVTGSAKCLEIVQRVIACAPVAAASRATTVHVMYGEVVTRAAPLTLEAVSFQRLLSVAAEVEVIARLAKVAVKTFLWHLRHCAAHNISAPYRRAFRTSCLRSLMVSVIRAAVLALVCRADDTRSDLSAAFFKLFSIVSRPDNWTARGAYLLNRASRLINGSAFLTDALTHPVSRLSMCRQGARLASFSVGAISNDGLAAVRAYDNPINCCFHAAYHGGR